MALIILIILILLIAFPLRLNPNRPCHPILIKSGRGYINSRPFQCGRRF
ncbi:MAG: hypothetical protein GY796_09055 [Chloroflexi bacterium]|nr:hypothetical protein [Chloroflexota bacterium]